MIVKNIYITIPEAVEYMKNALLKSTKGDTQNGGALKVYSFIDHRHEQNGFVMEQKCLGLVMDELDGITLQGNFFI